MNKRADLEKGLDSLEFRSFYYLKEELVKFCKKNNLQTSGSKIEITNRIAKYLETGEKTVKSYNNKRAQVIGTITIDSIIEDNFVCSEKHRDFYKEQIGKSFSFNVLFQKWLKSNSGKTYKESIDAYYKLLEEKKKNKTVIDKQFEYNTYIRDFFASNNDKNLEQAIKCWKYKKSIQGHNKYEKSDLEILKLV